ncbi:hypothetical protein EVAR_38640_1 [Eumeta japonica]|uniref:Uncharacterized protein n=1 Tax=Eumeta variegata TaxID=151549 RepID=A0A4C1Y0B4_EUMVA|nr:hypothetical protein EVAR_38640_1 [Eumeta japonica]
MFDIGQDPILAVSHSTARRRLCVSSAHLVSAPSRGRGTIAGDGRWRIQMSSGGRPIVSLRSWIGSKHIHNAALYWQGYYANLDSRRKQWADRDVEGLMEGGCGVIERSSSSEFLLTGLRETAETVSSHLYSVKRLYCTGPAGAITCYSPVDHSKASDKYRTPTRWTAKMVKGQARFYQQSNEKEKENRDRHLLSGGILYGNNENIFRSSATVSDGAIGGDIGRRTDRYARPRAFGAGELRLRSLHTERGITYLKTL